MSDPIRLFIFGLGYTATAIARAMQGRAASVAGTVRSERKSRRTGRRGHQRHGLRRRFAERARW